MDEKIGEVLECLCRIHLTIGTQFLLAFFASDLRTATTTRGIFYKDRGITRLFQAMLENSEYARWKRQTTARNRQLHEDFGPYFNTNIIHILRLEVVEMCEDSGMHLKPQDTSPQLCEEFSLHDYEKLYLEKAPIFLNLQQAFVLCR
jgi:hypothetical protein